VFLGLFLMLAALVPTLLCAVAPRFWVSDLAVHFRLQYVLVAVAACLILALTGHGYWATLSFLIAAVQALICAPLVNAPAVAAVAAAAAPAAAFRVAAANVWYRNRHFQRVADFAARESPDLILLAEVTAECEAALASLTQEYAHRFSTRGNRGTGLLLLSRWPMRAAVLPNFSEVEPAIAATLVIKERRVELLSVHTSWPIGPECTLERDRQLALIGDYARAHEGPLIVLGDLLASLSGAARGQPSQLCRAGIWLAADLARISAARGHSDRSRPRRRGCCSDELSARRAGGLRPPADPR